MRGRGHVRFLAVRLGLANPHAGTPCGQDDRHPVLALALRTAATLLLSAAAALPLYLGGFNPFIYFRF